MSESVEQFDQMTLVDVSPLLAVHDTTDLCLAEAELLGDFALLNSCACCSAKSTDIIGSEFGSTGQFANWFSVGDWATDMAPRFSADKVGNRMLRNCVLFGQCVLSNAASIGNPNRKRCLIVQFGTPVTNTMGIEPIACCIIGISPWGTEIEMVWVDAVFDIATVANLQSFRNWTVMNLPRYSMSADASSMAFACNQAELSVSVGECFRGPEPTISGLFAINLHPKSFTSAVVMHEDQSN